MKKNIIIAAIAAASLSVSCQTIAEVTEVTDGTLSFSTITVDELVETRAAVNAGGNFVLDVINAEGHEVLSTTWAQVNENGGKITLPAGNYVLRASSSSDDVPSEAFEQPVYGVEKSFSIAAGESTEIGTLVCTLLQCKVTVRYSDDFLSSVTGTGSANVKVNENTDGLDYKLDYNGTTASYDRSAGYFAVNNGENTSLVVTFKGSIDGKTQKMTKVITGIQPRQWRDIQFIRKVNEEGNASFDIQIKDMISDEILNNVIDAGEDIIGEDPDAPKGDGGIDMVFDYAAGCDSQFTDMSSLLVPTKEERDMSLKFLLTVPDGIKKFTVHIDSENQAFVNAVQAADAIDLDLINPSEANQIIFQVVPFPHGTELLNQKEVSFDMSGAQDAILTYQGTHTFTMVVTDVNGCRKELPIVMIVK